MASFVFGPKRDDPLVIAELHPPEGNRPFFGKLSTDESVQVGRLEGCLPSQSR